MPAADPRLSQTDLRRLEKLASAAGRTSRAMLKFVLRDGFAETERVVRGVRAGREDVTAGHTRTHAAVMSEAVAILSGHAKSQNEVSVKANAGFIGVKRSGRN